MADSFAATEEVVGVRVGIGGNYRSWFLVGWGLRAMGRWVVARSCVTMHGRRRPRQDARSTIHDTGDEIAVWFVGRFDAVDGAGHLDEQDRIVFIIPVAELSGEIFSLKSLGQVGNDFSWNEPLREPSSIFTKTSAAPWPRRNQGPAKRSDFQQMIEYSPISPNLFLLK